MEEIQLPEKLSDCLEIALKDLSLCEEDDKYDIDMGAWHSGSNWVRGTTYEVCFVCLAGSVMAKTLGSSIGCAKSPEFFNAYNQNRLLALDSLRQGFILTAIDSMVEDEDASPLPKTNLRNKKVAKYHCERDKFFDDMRGIVTLLREEGL